MTEPEKITANPDQATDTLDRLLRYAVQKGGVKSNQIEPAETPWRAVVERFAQMQAAPRAANPETVPALVYADFKPGSTRHDANVLAMGQYVVGEALAIAITDTWLGTEFSGGERHRRRIDAISRIESDGQT